MKRLSHNGPIRRHALHSRPPMHFQSISLQLLDFPIACWEVCEKCNSQISAPQSVRGPNESKSKMARNTTWQFCNETTLLFVWRHWLWLFLWMAKGALTRALHNSKLHRNSNVSDKSLQNLFPLNRSRKVWWRLVEFRVALPSSGNIAAACRTTALSFCFLWRALATAWDRDISKKKDYLPSPS